MTKTYHTRADWLAARREGLGGSDVPAILGLSRWKTPLQVWMDKVGLGEPSRPSYAQDRGTHMESFIADRLEQEMQEANPGWEVFIGPTLAGVIYTHDDHPSLRYSPDALGEYWVPETERSADVPCTDFLCEFKSHLRGHDDWAEEVPRDVFAQVQHGLDVTGLAVCYVAVDLGTEFRWARVERDDAWIEEKRPILLDWWERYVVAEEAPPPTESDEDRAALVALHPTPHAGTVVLDGTFLDIAWELADVDRQLKTLETRKSLLRNRVMAAIGDAAKGILPDGSGWTWSPVKASEYVVKKKATRQLRRFGAKKETD